MKKIFTLLLAALLSLSLVACGEKPADEPQQNEGGNEKMPVLEEILCTGEWYYTNMLTPAGLIFKPDGTSVGGGTWTINGTVLDCVWKNGSTTRFEIREVKGIYFMIDEEGITVYHGMSKPDWNALGLMPIQVGQDHLEVVCVDGQYRLQLKKEYMQAMYVHRESCYVDICYSQGDKQNVQEQLIFDFSNYYIKIENPDEMPLEIIGCSGVIYVLTDLM